MDFEVTVKVKWSTSAVDVQDAVSTIPYMVRVKTGYPILEATAEIKNMADGSITLAALNPTKEKVVLNEPARRD